MNPPDERLTPPNGWIPGYHSLRRIHRARSSELYVAVRANSGMESVVKVLLDPVTTPVQIEILQKLSGGPGVVPLLDLGRTASGQPFAVLPLYPEGSFGQVLGRSGPVSPEQAVAVGRSVGPALASLHRHELVHNAVAPENILAGSTSLLTGFGAATRIGSSGIKVRGRESFLHAPPEALRGDQLTPASDVYRLASTLWTLLAGRTPFSHERGESLTDQMYAERVLGMNAPPVPRRDVSRVLSRVLTRSMAKDPEERYQSAVDLATALERARTGTRSGAQPSFSDDQKRSPSSDARVQGEPSEAPGIQGPVSPSPGSDNELGDPLPPQARALATATAPAESEQRWEAPQSPDTRKSPAPSPEPRVQPKQNAVAAVPNQWGRLVGWTGDVDSSLPSSGESSSRTSSPEGRNHGDRPDLEPRWRRHLNIGVTAISIMTFTVVTGIVATLQPQSGSPVLASEEYPEESVPEAAEAPEPVVEPSPLPEVSPPSGVSLEDSLSAVTVSWTDHTGGTGSYFVVGGRQGHDPTTLARTGPGAVTAQINVDDTQAEYCFTVVAVDGGSGASDEVCTTRAAERQAEADRLAEEEAAEEEEEEEEADPSPSPSPSPNSDLVREPSPSATGDGD
ncbi:protein kinase [Nocardiopsis sp. B62]|nr:protein kinase [Nocardiopsis sp. B62]